MKRKLRFAVAAAVALMFCATRGQAETPVNATGWYGYEGYHPFVEGEPWGAMLEGYIKRNDVILNELSYFARIGLNYETPKGHRITGGYAFQYNQPYDSASEPYDWWDHRLWEQVMLRHPFGERKRHMFIHRFRVEQRWLQRKESPDYDETSEWKFENTFRYMARLVIPVAESVSLAFYDEIHLRVPPPSAERILDQNRVYGGLIFYLDKRRLWRLETGYMFQSSWNSAETSDERKRMNHTLRISITSDAPFSRK